MIALNSYCKIDPIAFVWDQRWYNDGSGGFLSAPNSILTACLGRIALGQFDFL
jgi:hypothetical protein